MVKEAPRPRLCHVRKTFPEQEYGFNLHAEKGKGQFIGSVDAGSPADVAGLKASDRIYAVNGAVIVTEDHKMVVSRIKEDPLQCHLLVIDEDGEAWYKERGLPITPDMPNILFCSADSDNSDKIPPPDYDTAVQYQQDDSPNFTSDKDVDYSASIGVKPRPRFCKVQKKTLQDEYGFNLHAEKGRGHFIGKVDDGSLAESAGLEQGQRIVGVNGTLIYPATPHKDVVFLIKNDPLCAELLVASPEVDEWHRSRDVPFSFEDAEVSSQASSPPVNAFVIVNPPTDPRLDSEPPRRQNGHVDGHHHHDDRDDRLSSATTSSAASDRSHGHDVTVISVTETPPPPNQKKETDQRDLYDGPQNAVSQSSPVAHYHDNGHARKDSHSSSASSKSGTGVSNGAIGQKPQSQPAPRPVASTGPASADLEPMFRLSAAEMREQLSRKKKVNPKSEQMSMQQKYEIVRNL